jgi:hypothetical protein
MKSMKMNIGNRQTYLYIMSALVLLVGLSSAVTIYLAAAVESGGDSAYEIIGGRVYPGSGNNKKYMHDLQLYGGQAAVLADEFTRWLGGLWQGTQLAYTVGCIAIFISLSFFIAARMSRPQGK